MFVYFFGVEYYVDADQSLSGYLVNSHRLYGCKFFLELIIYADSYDGDDRTGIIPGA